MNCQEAQQYLLLADDPQGEIARVPGLAEHIAGCPACQAMLAAVAKIEAAAPNMPIDGPADRPPEEFIQRLERTIFTSHTQHHATTGMTWQRAAAAAVFLALGAGAILMMLMTGPRARVEVLLSRLVDWNLQIAHINDPAERSRIYRSRVDEFRRQASAGGLTDNDQTVVENLLKNADWLTTAKNSLDVAEHFQHIVAAMPHEEKLTPIRQRVVHDGVVETLEQVNPAQVSPEDTERWKTLTKDAAEDNTPAPRSAAPAVNVPITTGFERTAHRLVMLSMATDNVITALPTTPPSPASRTPSDPPTNERDHSNYSHHPSNAEENDPDRRTILAGDITGDSPSQNSGQAETEHQPPADSAKPHHFRNPRHQRMALKDENADAAGASHLAEAIREAMDDEGSGRIQRKGIQLRDDDDDLPRTITFPSGWLPGNWKLIGAMPGNDELPQPGGSAPLPQNDPKYLPVHGPGDGVFLPAPIADVLPEPTGLIMISAIAMVAGLRRRRED